MKKWIPLLIIVALMLTVYFSGLLDSLSFDTIKAHRATLLQSISTHPFLAPLLFILFYTAVTALSLPGGALLSLLSGFLFGVPWGTLYVILGATTGATLLFLAARTPLKDLLRKKTSPFLQKMEKGFQKNGASYLLFLRFIPLFPFWLVNIAPAFFNIRTRTYIWTTCVGILPGSYIYTQAGQGLGTIFDEEQAFSLDTIFNTQMQIALVLLALFSLIPIFVKKFKHDR